MTVPKKIKELVDRFENNIENYKNPKYNETTVRQEFIDPLFIELGWDVNNKEGHAPQYRDVILEDSIKIGGKTKAPDYSFTLHGRRIFFLEAKKPYVDIVNDKLPAYQLRRYAWSGKLPLSVLTDFEHLVVYESKTRPKKTDSTKIGRVKLYHYMEYTEKWEEIKGLLSKKAVLNGSFDRFAEKKIKKGTNEVDDEFLKEIETWRIKLAKNIALRNKEINIDELNYAVQQTIDRIIFLRMTEDRGIEPYKQLLKITNDDNVYKSFSQLCKKADIKYNSGLFHFKEEKEINQAPDKFTLDLKIDNLVLKKIIKNLYYPNSPYEFSVLSPEILGNVYEQFLGKSIELNKSHQAKIKDKPEAVKGGGVVYTPPYIVDYIVENTVGKLLKNKTPNQVTKLKIIDPSCGSGSFLLGAYNYLLKWHVNYYSNLNKKPKNTIYQGKNEKWHLTIFKKKEILLNNIYGVDIDKQAVEVTKLSLLLKVLEDESNNSVQLQFKYERLLPHLGNNICCGNSLIDNNVLDNKELTTEQITKINPFDWNENFKKIMNDGGFDVVIGNPPYISAKNHSKFSNKERKILKKIYNLKGPFNIFVIFLIKAIKLTKNKGVYGWIVPNNFLVSDYANPIKNCLMDNGLYKSIDVSNINVFKKASVYPIIILGDKFRKKIFEKYSINSIIDFKKNNLKIEKEKFIFKTFKDHGIKIMAGTTGFQAKKIKKYIHNKSNKKDNDLPFAVSGSIDPYIINRNKVQYMKTQYSYPYISYGNEISKSKWDFWKNEKIAIAGMTKRIEAYYSKKSLALGVGCYAIHDYGKYNPYFLLGCLNSKFFTFYLIEKFKDKHLSGGYLSINKTNLLDLPMINKDLNDQIPLIEKVKKIIMLNEKLNNTNTPHERQLLKKQIKITDKKIDQMVYKLFDLTDDEIITVEKSLN